VLVTVPERVTLQRKRLNRGWQLLAGHDGYAASHGLTHMRNLLLSPDGRSLSGEDLLGALSDDHKQAFERALADRTGDDGIPISLRFHLHPDVRAEMGGDAVSLTLRSGEIWIFRHDGVADLSVEPSVHLEPGRLKPRPTRQIVLRARVTEFGSRIGWTLAKAQDTPQAVRDYED
jgi:uncharacterized heparinase superfamily protein